VKILLSQLYQSSIILQSVPVTINSYEEIIAKYIFYKMRVAKDYLLYQRQNFSHLS